jgi:hypothetical protein
MFEFWAYGNAPDGIFSALNFGYASGTVVSASYTDLENTMLSWAIFKPTTYPESWNVLPL